MAEKFCAEYQADLKVYNEGIICPTIRRFIKVSGDTCRCRHCELDTIDKLHHTLSIIKMVRIVIQDIIEKSEAKQKLNNDIKKPDDDVNESILIYQAYNQFVDDIYNVNVEINGVFYTLNGLMKVRDELVKNLY